MTNPEAMAAVHEKLNDKLSEYLTLLSPLERAENDILMAHRMLKARTEEEINNISPALGALSDELRISSVDILLADDPRVFVRQALEESGLSEEELRLRLVAASSTAPEELRLLGFSE